MRRLLIVLFCAAAFATSAEVLPGPQRAFLKNRRICVARDTTTLPGYVITTWHRNGKLDTLAPAVVTNELKRIVGAGQMNPIQKLAEQWQAAAEKWRTNYMTASNRAARAEARRDAIVAWAEEQRDAAVLPTTKALWQSIIDKLRADD